MALFGGTTGAEIVLRKILLAIALIFLSVDARAKDKLLPVKCGISDRLPSHVYQSMNWTVVSYKNKPKTEVVDADFSRPNDGFSALIPNSRVRVSVAQLVDDIVIQEDVLDANGRPERSVETSHNFNPSVPGERAEIHADFVGLDGQYVGYQVSCRVRQ